MISICWLASLQFGPKYDYNLGGYIICWLKQSALINGEHPLEDTVMPIGWVASGLMASGICLEACHRFILMG